MNLQQRNKIIIIVLLVVLVNVGIIVGSIFFQNYKPSRTVAFTFPSRVSSILITNDSGDVGCEENDDDECAEPAQTTLHSQGSVQLEDGSYLVAPQGDTISNDPIEIEVNDKNTSFSIDPAYSEAHLSTLLEQEMGTLKDTILAAYPASIGYRIDKGRLYLLGEWYATTLWLDEEKHGVNTDWYYVILHKVDGKWAIAAKPSLYFAYKDHPDIPRDIILEVNNGLY